jgi:hypothetical protein
MDQSAGSEATSNIRSTSQYIHAFYATDWSIFSASWN